MEVYIIHLAKSSMLLLAAYLIYLFFVRFTTFHYLNRSYLLFSVCISLLIPFIHFPVEEGHVIYAYTLPTIDLAPNMETSNHQPNLDVSYIGWFLYALVCIGLTLRLLYYLTGLVDMLYKHPKKKIGKFTLVHTNSKGQAFSFFRCIVIPPQLSKRDEQIIIEHEMLHAQKWHSLDVLLMEVTKVIFWFHPVIYLIKRELIQQHEFEIDRLLTTNTIDVEQYGNLLIQQAQQIPVQLSLKNNFNHSLIKNRIQMMTKPKSNKIQLLRYVLLLPILGLIAALMAFEKQPTEHELLDFLKIDSTEQANLDPLNAKPFTQELGESNITPYKANLQKTIKPVKAEKTKTIQTISKLASFTKLDSNKVDVKDNNVVFTIVEEMPEFPGGNRALFEHFSTNIIYPEAAQLSQLEGVVVLGFTVERDGGISDLRIERDIGGGCGGEAIRVANLMPKWSPGKQLGKTVRVAFKLPVRFGLGTNKKESTNATDPKTNTLTIRKDAIKRTSSNLGIKKNNTVKQVNETSNIVEQMPKFPGGEDALFQFFGANIIYPETAKEQNIQGVVVLDLIVEKDGSISDLKVIRDIGGGCGNEVLRVAKLMPKWSPGMEDGKAVQMSYKLPIRLKLNSDEPKSDK